MDFERSRCDFRHPSEKQAYDSMSKGATSHTYHTNLFITYYDDVLGPIFVCGLKTEGP